MPLQRLSPLDSSFIHLETPNAHMHIGGVGVFEPGRWESPVRRYEALIKQIGSRLDRFPRARQRVVTLPLNLDAPLWVDDEDFDLRHHVRRAALPHPGGERELCELVEHLFSQPLDRRRPLWEVYCVEGLPRGRWAIITKTHHSVVDGMSVFSLTNLYLEDTRDPKPARARPWAPDPPPRMLDVLVETARERLAEQAQNLRSVADAEIHPLEAARALAERGGGLAALFQNVRLGPSPINGPAGPTRSYWFSRFRLDDFKEVKNAFGATVNDVVLAVVSGALREYLAARGEDVDSLHLRALCPVSLRPREETAGLGNELAMMVVPLSVHEPDAAVRMTWSRSRTAEAKRAQQAGGADTLRRAAGALPGPLHPLLARGMGLLAGYNTIVTNIPGPQYPLYALGSRMEQAMPIAFLYGGQKLSVAILSYDGEINFGFIGDRVTLPDLELLGDCADRAMRELLDVVRRGQRRRRPSRTRSGAAAAAGGRS